MKRPLIVEIHLIVKPKLLEICKSKIIDILRDKDNIDCSIVPLYINSDLEDTELRICLQMEDPVKIDQFIIEKIRSIDGVLSTRVRLTLNGQIFPKGVTVLAETNSEYYSCHIFLKINPRADEKAWKSLCELKETEEVFPTWIFRDFYDYDRDITLRLMGVNPKAIRSYINTNVNVIDGIESWRCKYMYNMITIAKREELLELAKKWFNV